MSYTITLRYLFYISVVFTCTSTYSQKYDKIDDAIKMYPKSYSDPQLLANRISKEFSNDEDKVRAAFCWIAMNISYDYRLAIAQSRNQQIAFYYTNEEEHAVKLLKFQKDLTAKTIKSGMGVCQGYAALFHTVCDMMGVKCMEITGTSKSNTFNIGQLPKASDHVWNVVKIGADWKLIDVTWAAGAIDSRTNKFIHDFNDAYFFTKPETFFFNHFPDDTQYLLTGRTEQDFAQLPLYYGSYLKANYAFVSPDKGTFSNADTTSIPFKIVDLPENHRISYAFTGESSGREPVIRHSGNVSEFEIEMNKKSRGYLTVYVDGESIVSYKINK